VSQRRSSGVVVVDTGVFAADVVRQSPLLEAYGPMLVGRHVYVSFQTVAEVRFGAYRAGWGPARLDRLDAKIANAEVVWPGPELVEKYARLRAEEGGPML
jgi:tRNA(fMet)-specific endonuclease VapC